MTYLSATSQIRLQYFLRAMICVGSLSFVLYRYDAGSVFLRLQQLELRWLFLAWLFWVTVPVISALKWRTILRSYGRRDSLIYLWRLNIEANFFNLFFPGFVAGDISRVVRTSESGFSAEALTAVLVERFSGLLVTLLFIGSVALVGGYAALGSLSSGVILPVAGLALAGVALLLSTRLTDRAVKFLPGFLMPLVGVRLKKARKAVHLITSNHLRLGRLAVLSLAITLLVGPGVYLVAKAVDFPVPLHVLILYAPLLAFLSNLPISISGIGVRETLWVFVFSALGFVPEDIIAYALTLSAMGLVVNLSGAGLLLLRVIQPKSRSEVPIR